MRRLLAAFRRYIPTFLLQLVAIFLMVAATLELPDSMARVINQGVLKHDNALMCRDHLPRGRIRRDAPTPPRVGRIARDADFGGLARHHRYIRNAPPPVSSSP